MPAFHRQPRADQLGRAAGVGLLDEARHRMRLAVRRAALDVAVGGGRPGRLMPKTTMPPSAASRAARSAAAAKAAASGIRWSDGSTSSVALRVAPLGDAGGEGDRRQRVAALRLEHRSRCAPGLARLVGDHEPRRGAG